jgi:O-antigen ligase
MVEPSAARRAEWSLQTVRAAAALTAIGAVTSPPVGVAGSAVMLIAFAFVPDALARLGRVLREPLGRGLLVLAAALLVATVVGAVYTSPAEALRHLLGWRHLLLLPIALAVFDTRESRMRFAYVLIGIAVMGAIASLIAAGVGYSRNASFPGIVLRNPVTQALALSIGALLAAVLAVAQTRWTRAWRATLAIVALLLVAQLAFQQTGRSGFVALAVACGVATLLLLRGRALVVALVALPLLGVTVLAASPNLKQRFGMAVSEMRHAATLPEYTSMGIRVIIWQTSAEVVAERPLLGYGLGGFAPAYAAHIKTKYSEGWKALPVNDPHNQYLFLWAELGVLGLVGFIALLAGAIRQPADDPLRAAALALLAAWCVNSLFSSHFQTFNEGHLIVLLLGVFLARTVTPEFGSVALAVRAPAGIA